MTTLSHSPVQGDLLDELELIADAETPLGQDHYEMFLAACRAEAAEHGGWVDPNRVRARLTVDGELQINVRAYSAMWSRATGKSGPMVTHRTHLVPIVGAGSRGNHNKAVPMRRWVGAPSPATSLAASGGSRQPRPDPPSGAAAT